MEDRFGLRAVNGELTIIGEYTGTIVRAMPDDALDRVARALKGGA